MADNITTPTPDGKILAFKDIGGILYAWNLLADAAGVDVMGLVAASPAANTLLGRLKAIQDLLTTTNGYVDGLEGLATTLNGLVDGLEALGAAATPAGENYIGKNGGDVFALTAAPTVSTTAYAAGDVVGTKMTLAGATRLAAGSGIVQALLLHSKGALTGSFDVLLFSADPSASTFTDNAALALNVADFDKLIGIVHITDWTSLGTPSLGQALSLGLPFKLAASNSSLYAVLVARGTPTLVSTSALTLGARIIPG